MRFLACILCILAFTVPAVAEPSPATPEFYLVSKIISANELVLADGRTLYLEGIKGATNGDWQNKALQALGDLTASHQLTLDNGSTDRYGRLAGQADILDGASKIWLQGEMLKRGLAFVYPPTGDEARLDEMLALEAAARHAKTGIWADENFADIAADKAMRKEGGFAFVSGIVLDAARVKNMVYLNFGENWRNDFTVAVAAHDLHLFRRAKFDLLALKGKTIRVRGWVKYNFGPMIAVTNPGQIEVLMPEMPDAGKYHR